ncbi:O-methyltransferase family 2 [Macrophomina phaseolina MS6]|uniref:O-methyltransferase family 2 n=1 Tax=Macrophomina phaseolina (strain MS6) TaxID=1126212 RepID=K2RYR9_MACPH|nr:O-methyltransferase family 2 [Macrophomina phaseolina MS6]
MESIVAQIKTLAGKDDATRKSVIDALIKLQHSLETPFELIMRLYNSDFETVGARMAVDLGIFRALSESEQPLTVADLAQRSGAAPQLMGRILRYLASIDMIDETDKDTFTANHITKLLADPDREGGIHLSFDVQGPTNQALPDFLLERQYQDVVKNTDTAFNRAWKTELPFFFWVRTQPKLWDILHHALQVQWRADWLSGFELTHYLGGWTAQPGDGKVLFVDVGGSMGVQCANLKAKHPGLPGRVILQDMQEAIDIWKPIDGVEGMAQDYYAEQAFYYYRNIFHDNPDESALKILAGLRPAFAAHSLLLIDDKVLPDRGVHRHATMLDLAMMAQVGSLERTRQQWHDLLAKAGWEIIDVVTYDDEYDSVLVVKPADM